MKVILLADIPRVGKKYDVKNVKDGYAQNFLIPQKKAVIASADAIKGIELKRALTQKEGKEAEDAMQETFEKLEGKKITVSCKANEQGHCFSKIHPEAIQSALQKEIGAHIPESAFPKSYTLKEVGEHELVLSHDNLTAKCTIVVEKE